MLTYSHRILLFIICSAAIGCRTKSDDSAPQAEDRTAPPLSASFVEQLTRSEACTDTWVYAWDEADQVGMTISAEGVMQQAHQDGAFSQVVDLANSAWWVHVEMATGAVSMNWCVDVYGERDILRTYRATAGALQLDVAPAESGDGGNVSVTLTDVVLVDESDGHSVTVPTWQQSGIYVSASWGG
jgi:hypothetical protein